MIHETDKPGSMLINHRDFRPTFTNDSACVGPYLCLLLSK